MIGLCKARLSYQLLGDILCLPDGVEVESVSIDDMGNLYIHMSGADDEYNGKEVSVIHTATHDRANRYVITSEIKGID